MTTPTPTPPVLTDERIAELRRRLQVATTLECSASVPREDLEALLSAASELSALRARVEALREAHLWHVYEGELTAGCQICQCKWLPGDEEQHDADCIAAPEEKP